MRIGLTIACLAAVSQAISLTSCPPPCNPSGDDFNPDTDHAFKTTIDITEDVIEDEKEIVEEVVEETGVKDLLVAVVGCEEAADVVDTIVKPMVELEVAEMLPIKQAVEVIKTMNDDEKVDTKDELPTHEEVWNTITSDEQRAIEEPEIQFHAAPTLTPEQMDNSTVTKLTTPDGQEVDIIVVNKGNVEVTEGACPNDDLDEKAEEIADEIVDEIEEEVEKAEEPPAPETETESESEEEEPVPVPEPKPEPPVIEEPAPVVEAKPEPKPAKKAVEVYKTQVETMDGDASALDKLLEKAGGRPLVLDFQYDECGHCQEIAPRFEELMLSYKGEEGEEPDVMFYKVNIFEHRDRLQEWGITRFPTFQIYVLGKFESQLEGKDVVVSHELDHFIEDARLKFKNEQDRLAEEAEMLEMA